MKGRNGSAGIMQKLNCKRLGNSVIIASSNVEDEMLQFFTDWNVPFKRHRIII